MFTVSKFYKNLVKWTLTEMECSVAGTTTLDRENGTLLVIKTRQLLSERESQSAMMICRVCARRFFQFPVMFINNKKWRSTSWLTMLNSLFSFPTFLLFSPFRLVRSNTHYTPTRRVVGILEYPCPYVRPSLNLVYVTSHLSFVGFYSYLVSWLAMI